MELEEASEEVDGGDRSWNGDETEGEPGRLQQILSKNLKLGVGNLGGDIE